MLGIWILLLLCTTEVPLLLDGYDPVDTPLTSRETPIKPGEVRKLI